MKKFINILLIAFTPIFCSAKSYVISSSIDWVAQVNTLSNQSSQTVYNRLNFKPLPGDTILIQSGLRTPIRFDDIKGDSLHPIVIMNYGGKVIVTNPTNGYFGLAFNNCKYIHLSGRGVSTINYGIQVKQIPGGSGVSINNFSSNFEVDYLEIDHIGSSGIVAKTDPACSNYPAYLNFVLFDLKIHHNYIHQTGNEGMYIGYTGYAEGNGVTLSCSNPTVTAKVLPHKLIGVSIYQNIVDSTGWDGIQVSAATQVNINDNYISNDSYADITYQMSGIMIGEPASANIYNNSIINGNGISILVFGVGCNIYNNFILSPARSKACRGQLNSSGQVINASFLYGIYINDKVCIDPNVPKTPFQVFHNTIIIDKIYPTGAPYNTYAPQGINLNSLNYISGSNIANNLIVIDTNFSLILSSNIINGKYNSNSIPNYSISNSPAFISSCALNNLNYNYYSNEVSSVNFINYMQQNFHLNSNSGAIDQGVPSIISSYSYLNRDKENRVRPLGTSPDDGCFESSPAALNNTNSAYTLCIPNPISRNQNSTITLKSQRNSTFNQYKITCTGVNNNFPETVLSTGNFSSALLSNGYLLLNFSNSNLPILNGLYSFRIYIDNQFYGYTNVMIIQ